MVLPCLLGRTRSDSGTASGCSCKPTTREVCLIAPRGSERAHTKTRKKSTVAVTAAKHAPRGDGIGLRFCFLPKGGENGPKKRKWSIPNKRSHLRVDAAREHRGDLGQGYSSIIEPDYIARPLSPGILPSLLPLFVLPRFGSGSSQQAQAQKYKPIQRNPPAVVHAIGASSPTPFAATSRWCSHQTHAVGIG